MKYREEQDTMGTVLVPEDAYYGAQTQRAVQNFSISGLVFPSSFIRAVGIIKKCAARANQELRLLDPLLAEAIMTAAGEVSQGKHDAQFVVDVFQTGSGTSTNMNANEVIAGRANEILTGTRGGKSPVHPNDHVNMSQSSNDVIPTAIHVAALSAIRSGLLPAMADLHTSLERKALEFAGVRKIGRTHLQDALPVTLGQEFGAYARQVELAVQRIKSCESSLAEVALGGTAVGNGLNAPPGFASRAIELMTEETGCPFVEAKNHFEAQAAQDAAVETSGALKSFAVSLIKIANDIRLLASGPRCGLGEITLPSIQPGSSIMPGKVNPVIPETVIQAAGQVIANDAAITFGGHGGFFELNLCLPLIAYNLLQSIRLLQAVTERLHGKCVDGITPNTEKCRDNLERSLAVSTVLAPVIGYDRTAALVKEAHEKHKTVREVAISNLVMSEEALNRLFDELIHGVSSRLDEK